MRETTTGRKDVAAWALAALAAAHALSYWGAGPVDDDYIVHRYARNLLAGHGFVFNVGGEAAEGFTSPLWLGVSVVVQALGLPLEAAVRVLGAAASAVVAAALVRAGQGLAPGTRLAAWPGLAAAVSPALAYHAGAGLGTAPLAAFLALFAASCLRVTAQRDARVACRAHGVAGAWLGLACLTRQEAVVFVLPFAGVLAHGVRSGRLVRRDLAWSLAPALLALGGWTLARLVLFERLDPVTHAVKRLPLLVDLGYGARYLARATIDSLALVWTLGALLVALGPRRAGAIRGLAWGVVLHVVYVFAVGGDWMPLARFCVPALPLGLLCLAALLAPRGEASPGAARGVAVGAGLVLVLLQGGQLQRAQVHGEHAFFERRWLVLGAHFRAHAPADARVALSPIGAFAYASRLPIVDLLGLTHTRLLGVAPDLEGVAMKGHHRYDADWVLSEPPEYVILGNGVLQPATGRLDVNPWERTLVLDPRFRAQYLQVTAIVAGEETQWFRRRDAAAFPNERVR